MTRKSDVINGAVIFVTTTLIRKETQRDGESFYSVAFGIILNVTPLSVILQNIILLKVVLISVILQNIVLTIDILR